MVYSCTRERVSIDGEHSGKMIDTDLSVRAAIYTQWRIPGLRSRVTITLFPNGHPLSKGYSRPYPNITISGWIPAIQQYIRRFFHVSCISNILADSSRRVPTVLHKTIPRKRKSCLQRLSQAFRLLKRCSFQSCLGYPPMNQLLLVVDLPHHIPSNWLFPERLIQR